MPADKPPGQEEDPSTPTAPPMDLPRLSTGGKDCFTPVCDNYLWELWRFGASQKDMRPCKEPAQHLAQHSRFRSLS